MHACFSCCSYDPFHADVEQNSSWHVFAAPVGFIAISVLYACLASIPISFIEPAAGGSGITEIKAILNGVDLPGVLRFKALACKVVGVVFSVASGLACGKEGPMVMAGSAIGPSLSTL